MIPQIRFIKSSFKILLLCLVLFISYTPKVSSNTTKKVLLIDIPRLYFNDISNENCPYLNQLFSQGTVGIMTSPIDDPITPAKVYYDLNSSNKIKVIEEGLYIFDSNEYFREMKAGDLYRALTGYRATETSGVNIGLAKMFSVNHEINGRNIGLLGDILQRNQIRTAVIGNLDSSVANFNRSNAALLMNSRGFIDYSALSSGVLLADSNIPPGLRNNSAAVLERWEEYNLKSRFILITLGDLERINEFRTLLPTERLSYYRQKILAYYDILLHDLLQKVNLDSTLVVIFSPVGPDNVNTSKRINPVFILGKDKFNNGILLSDSTRRNGIITGYDIITTSLIHLGIDKKEYPRGRLLRTIPGDWHKIQKDSIDLSFNHMIRWPILTYCVYLLLAIIIVFCMGIFFWKKQVAIFKWLERIYILLLAMPVVFLIISFFNPVTWISIIGLITVINLIILILVNALAKGQEIGSFWWLSLITVGVVLVDGLFNGKLQLRSVLGYSAISGIRFYGIGNEYLGFFLGAYIIVISLLKNKLKQQRYGHAVLSTITICLAIFLAHPMLGANIGGGITALIGLGISNLIWLRQPIRYRDIFIIFISLILFLFLVGIWDLSLKHKTTHFGQLINIVRGDGFETFLAIVQRKLQMNLNLINYTPLSYGLIGMLFLAPILYKKPPRFLEQLMVKHQELIIGVFCIFFTALVALLVNDSGIVSVATMFSFGINLILLVLLIYVNEEHSKEMNPIE